MSITLSHRTVVPEFHHSSVFFWFWKNRWCGCRCDVASFDLLTSKVEFFTISFAEFFMKIVGYVNKNEKTFNYAIIEAKLVFEVIWNCYKSRQREKEIASFKSIFRTHQYTGLSDNCFRLGTSRKKTSDAINFLHQTKNIILSPKKRFVRKQGRSQKGWLIFTEKVKRVARLSFRPGKRPECVVVPNDG